MRQLPVPTSSLQDLIRQALLDLREARRTGDPTGIQRAEARMNSLLDLLSRRTRHVSVAA